MNQPILYAATAKAELPPYVLQRIGAAGQELACDGCKCAVMVSRASMAEVNQAANRNGVEIVVLCPTCFDKQMANTNSLIFVYQHDAEVQSHLNQHVAEQN